LSALHIILSIKYFVCETVVKVLTSEQRGRNLSGVDPAPDGKDRAAPDRLAIRRVLNLLLARTIL
jgi:hypothetical protein